MPNYRRLSIIIVLLVLAGFAGAAMAQDHVTVEVDLEWVLPTTDTLGEPLTGINALQKVQVYGDTQPIPADATQPIIELPPAATTYEWEGEVANGSTLYFRLRACNDLCSAMSNEAFREVRISVPDVPTGITIQVRVNLQLTAD